MSDPTGTASLRRSFLAEGNRRLARLRSLTHTMLVEHDLMAARNGQLASLLPHPGNRLAAFTQWFEQTVNTQLLGGHWWERFLERAYHSGFVAGSELAGVPASPMPLPAVFRELASREFAGIAAALVQQVSRQAADAALGRRKPQPMYRQVRPVLQKVGYTRVRAAANTLTVKIHNAGRLAQFRAAGIKRVGIIPERLERRLPSRFSRLGLLKRDHLHDALGRHLLFTTASLAAAASTTPAPAGEAEQEAKAVEAEARVAAAEEIVSGWVNIETAGDDDVCLECEDIAESGPYEIEEADILIPAHPNCRCSPVPAIEE